MKSAYERSKIDAVDPDFRDLEQVIPDQLDKFVTKTISQRRDDFAEAVAENFYNAEELRIAIGKIVHEIQNAAEEDADLIAVWRKEMSK